jgi:hypothetical protein
VVCGDVDQRHMNLTASTSLDSWTVSLHLFGPIQTPGSSMSPTHLNVISARHD